MPKRLLITGAGGLVGTALCRRFSKEYSDTFEVIPVYKDDYDLTEQEQVRSLFYETEPNYVIHAGARVGGIKRNLEQPIDQYEDNVLMNTFVLSNAFIHGCSKVITFGTICSYPMMFGDDAEYQEDDLHVGEPFPAHRSYAYAKRMMDIQMDAWVKQYPDLKGNVCSIIPTNIFGIEDNFDLSNGHVLPMLIHKCFESKKQGKPLEVWGNGEPFREFIYSDDLARITFELLMRDEMPFRLITSNKEFQIKDVVEMVCKAFDYHNVVYDTTKPNGQMRRKTSKELFNKTFPDFLFTPMDQAIKESVEWFIEKYPNVRGVKNG